MSKIKLTTVTFEGSAEQEAKLRNELQSIKAMKGNLMPALQTAQEIYGYLPIEVQKIVADELSISLEDIFGVVTFYSQFTLNPKGKTIFSVCLGTACYVKGSGDIFEKIASELGLADGETSSDRKYTLASTRCIGCCGLAPVVTVNDDVFGKLGTADIPAIIAKYRT